MEKSKKRTLLVTCNAVVILILSGLCVYGYFFRNNSCNMVECPKCNECQDDLNVGGNITSTRYWKENDGKYVADSTKFTAFTSDYFYSDEDEIVRIYMYGNRKSLYWAKETNLTEQADDYFKDSQLIKKFDSNIKTIKVINFRGQAVDDVRAVIILLENGDVYISDYLKENNYDFYKNGNSYKKSDVNRILEIVVKNSFDTSCIDGAGCYLDYVYALDNTGNYYYLLKGYYE